MPKYFFMTNYFEKVCSYKSSLDCLQITWATMLHLLTSDRRSVLIPPCSVSDAPVMLARLNMRAAFLYQWKMNNWPFPLLYIHLIPAGLQKIRQSDWLFVQQWLTVRKGPLTYSASTSSFQVHWLFSPLQLPHAGDSSWCWSTLRPVSIITRPGGMRRIVNR